MKKLLTLISILFFFFSFNYSQSFTKEERLKIKYNSFKSRKEINESITDVFIETINGFSGITMLSGINYEYRIENILPRSPSDLSGVKVKDKLISVNGEYVTSVREGFELLHSGESSDLIYIDVERKRFLRSTEYLSLEIMLSSPPPNKYLRNVNRQYFYKRGQLIRRKNNIVGVSFLVTLFYGFHYLMEKTKENRSTN